MEGKLKSEIQSAFKLSGYTLKSDALKYLHDALLPLYPQSHGEWLEKSLENIQKLPLLDVEVIQSAIKETANLSDDSNEEFRVIDAFSVPRMHYVPERKKFLESADLQLPPPELHADANDKASLYVDRYTVIQQQILRHHLFSTQKLDDSEQENCQLRTVENLLSTSKIQKDIVVLGMLTQLKEDKFYLEDPTGVVLLDLSETQFHVGLFTENSIVLAEGTYEDSVFKAKGVGFPPVELATKTRLYFGNVNFFGGPSKSSAKSCEKLQKLEAENLDAMMVFLSDVWLDQPKVMASLRKLFTGYSDSPPLAFVLCGGFLSNPHGLDHLQALPKCFKQLVELISEFPNILEHSNFVFVPSLQDPLLMNILPRPPLPLSLAGILKQKIPKCHLASNPCRIQYCTQEIVVFREDLTHKMCRNTIKMPTAKREIPQHLAKTLLSQSHLVPLPIYVSPVYWQFDHSLRLYPVPDLLVIADKYDPFTVTESDCIVANPGSFARNNFAFKVYIPATKEVEDSIIPSD